MSVEDGTPLVFEPTQAVVSWNPHIDELDRGRKMHVDRGSQMEMLCCPHFDLGSARALWEHLHFLFRSAVSYRVARRSVPA